MTKQLSTNSNKSLRNNLLKNKGDSSYAKFLKINNLEHTTMNRVLYLETVNKRK
jgi:hypothetical protein